jgi:branched-chain amino acid transport system ATP-binding protein
MALYIQDVSLAFEGVVALNQLSLSLPLQGICGVIGPNGAGKSTLFNVVTGIYKPQKGQILLGDTLLNSLSPQDITALGIARTFQNIRLLPGLNVLENLYVATVYERQGTFFSSLLGLPSYRKKRSEWEKRATILLEEYSLLSCLYQYPNELPYGAQRKLEIVRALMRKPRILLLDEPAAGLNATEKQELAKLVAHISQRGIGVVVIEHDMKFVMSLCEHVFVLNQGALMARGTPLEVQQNDLVVSTYLGGGVL